MRSVVTAVVLFIRLLNFLILVRCVLSFIPRMLYTKAGHVVVVLTEPVLGPCRRLMDRFQVFRGLPLDFSPLLAMLLLGLLTRLVTFFYYL